MQESVADFYLRKHRYELAWIRSGLRSLTLYNWINNVNSHELVRDKWVRGQLKYFKNYISKQNSSLHVLRVITWLLFMGGFVLAFILLILGFFFDKWLHEHHTLQNLLIILMFLLPAIGAAIDGYREKIGVENNVKRYQQMLEIFQRADSCIINNFDKKFCEELFIELGKISLEETNDLVITHREHPIDLPKG